MKRAPAPRPFSLGVASASPPPTVHPPGVGRSGALGAAEGGTALAAGVALFTTGADALAPGATLAPAALDGDAVASGASASQEPPGTLVFGGTTWVPGGQLGIA
jgi:hypothetical protein